MGNTQLALLPDKQQLAEVNNRIKVMLPGGAKLSNEERFALAQIAVAHGLDPFNGEVWYIPSRGPMISGDWKGAGLWPLVQAFCTSCMVR